MNIPRSRKDGRKIKILYVGNFSDPEYEGLMTMVKNIRSNLNFGDIYVENGCETDKVDLINIHSSGFYESVKLMKMKGVKIYSLHANIIPLYFQRLIDYIQWLFFLRTKESNQQSLSYNITKIVSNMVSNFIPLFIKRFFLEKMDAVIVPNIWLLNKLKLSNAYLIRHGIDIQKFRNIKTRRRNDKKIIVSYFGHPDPEKGVLELIDSFSKLQNPIFEKKMFFTEKNKKIENLVARKNKSIKVFGFVKDIVNKYNDSDIIVLPYRHCLGGIATPLVLIEAMGCEKAVITTDLPHLREICGDAVTYVKPYSTKSIVNAIEFLAKTPELREILGKKARKRIVKYYNQEEMFKNYERLYKSFISSSRQQTNAS